MSIASQLERDLTGRVIGPDDPGYDEARTVFYGNFDRRPVAIARVANGQGGIVAGGQLIGLGLDIDGIDFGVRTGRLGVIPADALMPHRAVDRSG